MRAFSRLCVFVLTLAAFSSTAVPAKAQFFPFFFGGPDLGGPDQIYSRREVLDCLSGDSVGIYISPKSEQLADPRDRHALLSLYNLGWVSKVAAFGQPTRHSLLAWPPEAEPRAAMDTEQRDYIVRKYAVPEKIASPGELQRLIQQPDMSIDRAVARHVHADIHSRHPPGFFSINIIYNRRNFERLLYDYQNNMARVGIELRLHFVAPDIYIEKLKSGDFDMAMTVGGKWALDSAYAAIAGTPLGAYLDDVALTGREFCQGTDFGETLGRLNQLDRDDTAVGSWREERRDLILAALLLDDYVDRSGYYLPLFTQPLRTAWPTSD